MQGFCIGIGLATDSFGIGTMFELAYTLLKNKKNFYKTNKNTICYNKWYRIIECYIKKYGRFSKS